MRLATGISNMLLLKSKLYSTMCFQFCIWQNYSVNTRGKKKKRKIFASTYVKLEPGDIRCAPEYPLNCSHRMLCTITCLDTRSFLSKNQSAQSSDVTFVKVLLLSVESTPLSMMFGGNWLVGWGRVKPMQEVVPQRGGAALGDGLLDSCRSDR